MSKTTKRPISNDYINCRLRATSSTSVTAQLVFIDRNGIERMCYLSNRQYAMVYRYQEEKSATWNITVTRNRCTRIEMSLSLVIGK